MTGFVVFSLPRSRSAWLSLFLSYAGREVGHDIGPDCASVGQFMAKIGDGTCETGAIFAWPLIRRLRPDLKLAIVRRDPHEVTESLERFGVHDQLIEMQRRSDFLEDLSAQRGVVTVDYEDVSHASGCKRLFEHCLDEEFDLGWWRRFDPINIQVDMDKQIAKLVNNRARIEALKAEVEASLALARV